MNVVSRAILMIKMQFSLSNEKQKSQFSQISFLVTWYVF